MDAKTLAEHLRSFGETAAADLIERQAAELEVLRAERDALQAALTASMSKCRGIPDSRCNYLAHCYGPCDKCGRQHDAARARTEGGDGASVDADRAAN